MNDIVNPQITDAITSALKRNDIKDVIRIIHKHSNKMIQNMKNKNRFSKNLNARSAVDILTDDEVFSDISTLKAVLELLSNNKQ
jgi:hypothetical protein